MKKSAAVHKMWVHEGPAMVFDSMEAATEVVVNGGVQPGSVIVIRYEGPGRRPRHARDADDHRIMQGMGLSETTALVTDGRFSGSTRGPCIGYVSPEAALGGPLAFVRNGDRIAIDIPAGKLELRSGRGAGAAQGRLAAAQAPDQGHPGPLRRAGSIRRRRGRLQAVGRFFHHKGHKGT